MFEKHPTIFVSAVLLILISFWEITEYIIDYKNMFVKISNLALLIYSVVITCLIIVCTLIVFNFKRLNGLKNVFNFLNSRKNILSRNPILETNLAFLQSDLIRHQNYRF